jgi:threonylcarbamoyladenosine tRNA methylthiotransferase MtaB
VTGQVVSHGCRLNLAEGFAIAAMLDAAGDRATRVVNTCAVTSEAEADGRRAVRAAAATGARVVVTGCAATITPDVWAGFAGVARVVANDAKLDPASWGSTSLPAPTRRTRAFIEAQGGCDHLCTFCVIPQGRGASRSVPTASLVARVRRAVEDGAKEVVLSGVDLTAWRDFLGGGEARLGDLVRAVLRAVPDLPRLRLSSVDVAEIDEALLRALAEEARLMPHLHLSLQAGDDLILKRMKRRHSRADALRFVAEARLRRPDLVFGADLIAGFPTESEAAFANTLALVDDCGLTWLHVFPFSARPGTPAARMPQVDPRLRHERAARLRAAGTMAAAGFARGQVGRTVQWLAESRAGHTEHFARLVLDGVPPVPGALMAVRVIAANDNATLVGVPA